MEFKAGHVSIIGKPNVGKSTLMNTILNEKLSPVCPKPQTTRHNILGILNVDNAQVIFIDTPGMMKKPKDNLDKRMLNRAKTSISDGDVCLYMIEPFEKEEIPDILKNQKLKILAINKVDLVNKLTLLPLIEHYNNLSLFNEIIPISAKKGDGCDVLVENIISLLPHHPPFYEKDILSIHPEKFFAQEIIREKVFSTYGEEIPYFTCVSIEEFAEREKGKDYIRAIVYVDRPSQKAIIIGKGGKALKKVGEESRKEIEAFYGKSIYLELVVKEKEGWRKKEGFLKEIGY
ncbi:TPA: GTPase Era [bacterium]|nr:GTPase Era [bacterium]